MKRKLNGLNNDDPHREHYVFHRVSRKFAKGFMSEDELRRIDEAKATLAERVGVRQEHVRLSIEMLVIVDT